MEDKKWLWPIVGKKTLAEIEREVVEATLQAFLWDKRRAASALGISLKTLYNKLNSYKRAA